MLKTYQNKQIIFRHKIFYLKHLVLTDIHYPTANLLAYSIYLEQEAIAEHCITLLSITAADPKPPNPYKTSQNYRCQPAKYQNHIHFFSCHIDRLETLVQMLSKANCFKNISALASIQNSHCYCSSKQVLLNV